APTVEICESDRPYEPLAMRQHATGPYPIDPSLIAQGIPPDDRITVEEQIFGPVEGTPMPPGVAPSGYVPGAERPPVAVATYNPRTGQYAAPDGKVYSQTDLVRPETQSWEDLLPK